MIKSVLKFLLAVYPKGLFFWKKLKIAQKVDFRGRFWNAVFAKKTFKKLHFINIYVDWIHIVWKKSFFFVLILKWHVYMVFLKWCPNMVILYNFLGTWQQRHFEVYKQHVDMVILLDFSDLMTTVAFRDASSFK